MKKFSASVLVSLFLISIGCAGDDTTAAKISDEQFVRSFLSGVVSTNEAMVPAGSKLSECDLTDFTISNMEVMPGLTMSGTITAAADGCNYISMSMTMTYSSFTSEGVTMNGSLTTTAAFTTPYSFVMDGTLNFSGEFSGLLVIDNLTIGETGAVTSGTVTWKGVSIDVSSL